MILHLIAQSAPTSGDPVSALLASLGAGGAVAFVMWRVYERETKRRDQVIDAKDLVIATLTERLFKLADKSSVVAATAQRVVEKDTTERDQDLRDTLDRLAGLLEGREP